MKLLCFIFLLLFLTVLTNAQEGICFLNKTGRQVLIQKRTILEDGAYPYIIDSNAHVFQSIPLQISRPAILNVTTIPPKGPYGTADGLYFLFKPGDSLIISLDKAAKPVIAHVADSQRTTALYFFQNHLAGLKSTLPYQLYGFAGNQALRKQIWSDNLKQRDRILDSLYRPYLNSVKDFSPGVTSAETEKWYYFYLGNLIADKLYAGYKIDGKFRSALRSFYADSLASWRQQLTCGDCGNIPPYNTALYATYKFAYGNLPARAFMDTVAHLAMGSNKNFLLARYMMDNFDIADNDNQLISYYQRVSADTVYSHIVTATYQLRQKQSAAFGKDAAVLIRPDKSEIGFTQMISQLKGKVVYVDFWASWCKPCIAELPYSRHLATKLEGKDVVMLYLSIDDDFSSWQKAAQKYKIGPANSYMMPAADKTALAQQIELGPIPRYLIIDKSGKIVDLDAPMPSDDGTFALLVKTLNEKE